MTWRKWSLALLFSVLSHGLFDLGWPSIGSSVFFLTGYWIGTYDPFEWREERGE